MKGESFLLFFSGNLLYLLLGCFGGSSALTIVLILALWLAYKRTKNKSTSKNLKPGTAILGSIPTKILCTLICWPSSLDISVATLRDTLVIHSLLWHPALILYYVLDWCLVAVYIYFETPSESFYLAIEKYFLFPFKAQVWYSFVLSCTSALLHFLPLNKKPWHHFLQGLNWQSLFIFGSLLCF